MKLRKEYFRLNIVGKHPDSESSIISYESSVIPLLGILKTRPDKALAMYYWNYIFERRN